MNEFNAAPLVNDPSSVLSWISALDRLAKSSSEVFTEYAEYARSVKRIRTADSSRILESRTLPLRDTSHCISSRFAEDSFGAESAEVFNEHQVAATLIELRVEEVVLIRRDREGTRVAPGDRDNQGHFAGCEI